MDRKDVLACALAAAADFYRKEGRPLPWRRDTDPYHVFLSEIMLQQTRVEAVIPYYERFLLLYPNVSLLAEADETTLLKAWEGLGYYSRARNLKRAAERVVADFDGRFPSSYELLLTLPGVGSYTAGAIASISFGEARSAVDGNALRLYTRLFADGTNIADPAFKKKIAAELDEGYPTGDKAGDVTQGLMEVGQRFCLPNGAPRCEGCPLRALCAVGSGGADYRLYPKKERKKPRRILERTVLLATDGEGFYIRKRPNTGLLAGLWEFPSADGPLSIPEAIECARAMGISAEGGMEAAAGKHVFTHLEWHMRGYLLFASSASADFVLASPKDLKEVYPIASAFRIFLDFIDEKQKEKP